MFFLFSARLLIGFQFLISVLPKVIFSRSHDLCATPIILIGVPISFTPLHKVSVLVEFVIAFDFPFGRRFSIPFVRTVREHL